MRKHSHKTGSKKSQAPSNQPKEITERTKYNEFSTKPIGRNQKVINNYRKLDSNQYIITGFTKPIICHIMPFAWNNSDYNVNITERFIPTISKVLDLPVDLDSTRALASLHATKGLQSMLTGRVASISDFSSPPCIA